MVARTRQNLTLLPINISKHSKVFSVFITAPQRRERLTLFEPHWLTIYYIVAGSEGDKTSPLHMWAVAVLTKEVPETCIVTQSLLYLPLKSHLCKPLY
jgi:hypothetical protein